MTNSRTENNGKTNKPQQARHIGTVSNKLLEVGWGLNIFTRTQQNSVELLMWLKQWRYSVRVEYF